MFNKKSKEITKENTIYVFIDASNLWEAQKAKGKFFDYQKLRNFIKTKLNASSGGESIEEKGNMDVEITIDVLHHIAKYDIAVFFTGDSDFLALVTYLRTRGKKVYIFSSKNNISEELRTGGDGYFDVLKIEENIWGRELIRRPK